MSTSPFRDVLPMKLLFLVTAMPFYPGTKLLAQVQASSGQRYNLVKETDALRSLEAAYVDDSQLRANYQWMSFIRDRGGGFKKMHHQVESDNGKQ